MAGVDETNALVDAGRFRVKHRSAHQKEHVLDALRLQAPRKNVIAGQLCHLRSPPLRSRHRCRAVTSLIGLDHAQRSEWRKSEALSAFLFFAPSYADVGVSPQPGSRSHLL